MLKREWIIFMKLALFTGIIACLIPVSIAGTIVNIPIYIETPAGIEKAGYYDILDILFNYDFEIQEKQEIVSDGKCSLRANEGSLEINGINLGGSDLSFNLNNAAGKGSLTAQKDRVRFSLDFKVQEILEINSEKLAFKASGSGSLNREKLSFDSIVVSFDKLNNKTDITGIGDKDFKAEGLKVTSTTGCLSSIENFYLLVKKGELGKGRSAEEVVEILRKNPEFLDVYWNLEKLHKEKWWIHIPRGNPGSIWTTKDDCGSYEQNVNQYYIEEFVYINGKNFKPGEYDWAITGLPGAASCDPNEAVAFGTLTVNESGAFCFNAYQIQQGDCKEYQASFGSKHDNYNVIPEFGFIAGALTIASSLALLFFIRKNS